VGMEKYRCFHGTTREKVILPEHIKCRRQASIRGFTKSASARQRFLTQEVNSNLGFYTNMLLNYYERDYNDKQSIILPM
jgi:hypothetical protein